MNLLLRGRKLAFGLSSQLGLRGLRYGVGASVEHYAALGARAFRTIVDVGANRGQFALFARHAFPEARILSFEPLSSPRAVFVKLFCDDRLVTLYPFALGSRSARTTIHIAADDDSSSLLPVGQEQMNAFGTRVVGTENVQVARLDQLLASAPLAAPALLKIDTQGYELQVLEGCGDLLCRFDAIYAELSYVELYRGQALAGEVMAFTQGRGFRTVGAFNQASDAGGRPLQADFLFAKNAT
jgi:FkbM family methyltransferase